MKHTILILFLSSMMLTGCDLEKTKNDDGSVRFVAYQSSKETAGTATKVTGTDFDRNDEITVFAPLAGNRIHGDYDQNAPKDVRYVADDNNRFSPKSQGIKYVTPTTKLDFYAVYPSVGPAPKSAVVDLTTYEIDLGDIRDQSGAVSPVVPYIYSNNAKGKSTADGAVTLQFRNVLSKIAIDVKYDKESLEGRDLSKIEFYAEDGLYRECVIDLKKETYDAVATNGGRTSALAVKTDPYLFRVPAAGNLTQDGVWIEGQSEGYIVPGRATNPVIRLTFGENVPSISVDGSTGESSVDADGSAKVYICRIPTSGSASTVNFEAGKMYTYTIQVSGTTPEVGIGGSIVDWVAAGGVPVIWAH